LYVCMYLKAQLRNAIWRDSTLGTAFHCSRHDAR